MSKNKKDKVSIIFHKKDESPKYFEINKSHIYIYFVALPLITVICIALAGMSIVQNSPFHLLGKYKQHLQSQDQINNYSDLEKMFFNATAENNRLQKELSSKTSSTSEKTTAETQVTTPTAQADSQKPQTKVELLNPIGLSTLSMFKPIKDQKDLTRPAKIGLSGFNLVQNANNIKLHFNIIPTTISDERISGHIIVLLKDGPTISGYPANIFESNDMQINFSNGESFLTQRFRPVEATFQKPKSDGNFTFTIYIFSKEGDLIHYQPVTIAAKQ